MSASRLMYPEHHGKMRGLLVSAGLPREPLPCAVSRECNLGVICRWEQIQAYSGMCRCCAKLHPRSEI